jgi:hypothetical protein
MKFLTASKASSRQATIISPYRESFGYALPSPKQYWTLCACCAAQGQLIQSSELSQILDSELIKPHQFCGVDYDADAIASNKQLGFGNFYHNDFYRAMAAHHDFNPGVVNMDLLNTFETEKNNIKRVFHLLSPIKNVLFNINVLIESHYVAMRQPEAIVKWLAQELTRGWSNEVYVYAYKGTGARTTMFSIGLIKA